MPRCPRQPSKIAELYEIVAAAVPPPVECDGITCFDMNCERCWSVFDGLGAIFDLKPGVTVDLDEATHAALSHVAQRKGTTVSAVAQTVLQRWAAGQGARK